MKLARESLHRLCRRARGVMIIIIATFADADPQKCCECSSAGMRLFCICCNGREVKYVLCETMIKISEASVIITAGKIESYIKLKYVNERKVCAKNARVES